MVNINKVSFSANPPSKVAIKTSSKINNNLEKNSNSNNKAKVGNFIVKNQLVTAFLAGGIGGMLAGRRWYTALPIGAIGTTIVMSLAAIISNAINNKKS